MGWDGMGFPQECVARGQPGRDPLHPHQKRIGEKTKRSGEGCWFFPLGWTDCPKHTLLGVSPCGRGLPHHSRPSVLYKAKSEVPKILFLLPWFAAGGKLLLYSRGGWSSTHHSPPLCFGGDTVVTLLLPSQLAAESPAPSPAAPKCKSPRELRFPPPGAGPKWRIGRGRHSALALFPQQPASR